jgi:non-specific serine/threonine protein kinase
MDGIATVRRLWRFAGSSFDEASLVLQVSGRAVELERRPLQLLALLLTHAGEIVTKDEILDALWPGREVTEASLTNCMARLRQALGETGHTAIRTVHGYGYRFAAPVTVEAAGGAQPGLPATAALAPGDAITARPNWRLVSCLGSGGYGDAWLAEQAKSGERRVFKFARDAAGLVALRREVAISRLLREGLGARPDMIRVLDWSFDALPPFIETAWAEHGNLVEWAARQGGAATVPLDTRIDIAAQMAEALAAIHGMAVLHKDLKPANVLIRIGAEGRPGVILTDFGSGRAMDPARLDALGITRPEGELSGADSTGGTQMYRAPELALGGAPTIQADIFALGIMLFQLVAGDLRQPLAPGWEALVADPLLREDIAAAAAGDPARRLEDAGALAQRLRSLPERRIASTRAEAEARYAANLRRELDLARARRAPLMALLCVLLLGFAVSTALYVRAERARANAQTQAARAEAVTAFLTDDLFSAANPELGADPNIPVRRVLGVALADLDRRFPPGSADRGPIEAAVGGAYAGLGDADHALPLLRAALADLRARLGDADPQTQAVRLAMGTLAQHRLDDAGMREAGQAILAAHPDNAAVELQARFFVLRAACGANGNSEVCARQLRPFLDETRQRLGARHGFTLQVQSELAYRLGDAQHFAEAIPLARQTLALTAQVFGADHVLVQERRFDLAAVLVDAGQLNEAIAILIDVRQRLLALAGAATDMSARVLNQLGIAYMEAKRFDDALAAFRTVLDYSVRTRGETASLSRAAMNNTADALDRMGRTRDAVVMAKHVLEVERGVSGADSPDALWNENNLGSDYEKDGNLAAAEAQFRDLVQRGREVFNHGEYDLGQFEYRLGKVLAAEGKVDEARGFLIASLAIFEKSLGDSDAHTVRARAALNTLNKK